MLGTRAVRSPLEPITTGVGCLTDLTIVLLIIGVLTRPQPALGGGPVCTTVPVDSGPGDPVSHQWVRMLGVAHGSHAISASTLSVCANHPDAFLRTTGMLMSMPLLVLFLSSLWLLRRFLKAAARPGRLYSLDSARRLRFLGWYLAGGAVLVGIIESVASGVVLAQQTTGVAWGPTELRFPWFAFLVGLGVITCARVMRIGVTMREDLDGTV
jgi:hypothetical protein